jgi:hypothetical protein
VTALGAFNAGREDQVNATWEITNLKEDFITLNRTVTVERRRMDIHELSDYTGFSPQTIYNQKKRIGRRLKRYRRDVDGYLDQLSTIN